MLLTRTTEITQKSIETASARHDKNLNPARFEKLGGGAGDRDQTNTQQPLPYLPSLAEPTSNYREA